MTTTSDILRLRGEAAEAGDLHQVALCDIAIHGEATGEAALEYCRATGIPACKHADPIEDSRDGLTIQEADEIAREDVSLIYVVGDREAAWDECERVIADAQAAE